MSKLILFGGKGGVGKTTTSAAVAIWFASQGFNTLLVSSDPAHSISDSLGQKVGSAPTPVLDVDHLWALEMNPQQIVSDLAPKLSKTLTNPLKILGIEDEVKVSGEEMMIPGLDEALAFDLLLKLVESQEYDLVIFDTAPTGHTLRFLSLPELTNKWITNAFGFREHLLKLKTFFSKKKNANIETLELFKRRVEHIRRFLSNANFTSFYIVLIPELLAVEESRRAKSILTGYRIPVKGAVINNIVPDSAVCRFCAARHRIQSNYIKDIEKEFTGLELAKVPFFEDEIQGIRALRRVSGEIMGKGQLNIQARKSMEKEYDMQKGLFHVRLFYPGSRMEDLSLKTKDHQLIIILHGIQTRVEAPFPLDAGKVKAFYQEDYLHITARR
ncbi:MAG: ArsA family ATPase [Thermodesulfobacteriota bacterium]|nr:ArsA family ATPase [Thermodesulfobacteriota bacterium]